LCVLIEDTIWQLPGETEKNNEKSQISLSAGRYLNLGTCNEDGEKSNEDGDKSYLRNMCNHLPVCKVS